ncbi:twin-arginine translocation signal domain-containing protein [Lignipirellula cremea]|uniref:NHL repeat protein n=1 Tax=Lignipirellula cremea TaxID=2528010 RepID=A0A518E0L2_9BACT|nr:twin-arginine translocation signal domain-containing protein [Lignipirellula cremea]QDU97625.1 NHL repeat protein [Lignipirellula cremea]
MTSAANSRPTATSASASRRQFLGAVGAGAAVLAAPSLLLAKKTDTANPVLGFGEFQYECVHDWGQLPSGHHYGNASHGVAIDKAGLIYITHYGAPGSIFVFDPDGKFVRAMGEEFVEQGHGVGHGIDIRDEDGQEFIYLSPSNTTLGFAKITLDGKIVWRKDRDTIARDSGLYEGDQRFRATNCSFSPDGGYYLGDGYGSGYLHHYDKNDKYVGSFGGTGTEDGKFRTPHGQWLDSRDGTPKIVVCDRANKRLQYFDLQGKYLSKLEGFLFPADIDIQGDLMLVPDLHCRVSLLDKENQVLTHLGDDPAWREKALDKFAMRGQRENWLPGKFVHPHDACFDKDGNIFVVEWVVTGRVSRLRKVS